MSNPQDNTASILQKNKKVLIASLTGSAIEWFDYFLYGTAAALVFNKIFFPMVDPVIGLILSWLSFSLTFFIRPIGGVIFAHIGDRIGRKKTLVLTLSLMGSATPGAGAYRSCSAPSSFFSACGSAKISTKRPPLSR